MTSEESWPDYVFFDSESSLREEAENGEGRLYHDPRLIIAEFWREGVSHWEQYSGAGLCERFWADVNAAARGHTVLRVIAHNAGYDVQATSGVPHLLKLGGRRRSDLRAIWAPSAFRRLRPLRNGAVRLSGRRRDPVLARAVTRSFGSHVFHSQAMILPHALTLAAVRMDHR